MKETRTFAVSLRKNKEQGGAWLLTLQIRNASGVLENYESAWSNPSAGKRWAKKYLTEITGRKTIKLGAIEETPEGKPTLIMGSIDYKLEV